MGQLEGQIITGTLSCFMGHEGMMTVEEDKYKPAAGFDVCFKPRRDAGAFLWSRFHRGQRIRPYAVDQLFSWLPADLSWC